MAETKPPQTIDPKSGFCPQTKTFHSLRPPVPLPQLSQPLSIPQYAFSLLHSTKITTSTTSFLIDSATGNRLSYSDFLQQTKSLSSSLQMQFPSLSKGHVAFILSPPSFHIPVLYFSLLSLGVIFSPANPLFTRSELTHLIRLSKPCIVFTVSSLSHKLPNSFPFGIIFLDSPLFLTMISTPAQQIQTPNRVQVHQSDSAAIFYSSGTTGLVKGVEITHRNYIAPAAAIFHSYRNSATVEDFPQEVSMFTLPLFHVFGFMMLIRALVLGSTLVLMERFDLEKMLMAVEKYRVTYVPGSPPLITAMCKSNLVAKYDISSLQWLRIGGAPMGKVVVEQFTARFPQIVLLQGYGSTESGNSSGMKGADESEWRGSAGRLEPNVKAKIVDHVTGEALFPWQLGELWLRSPMIMKGYVGDDEATAATLGSEGWLKTGDLCYFDSDGFLYIVDRLKELIKYKAYQVPPVELEHLLQSVPDIVDAAVVPYPDEEAGEIPMAYIVRKPGSNITEATIMSHVAKQVAPYKKIRRVAFINTIPRSPAGKILRRELISHALCGASSKL